MVNWISSWTSSIVVAVIIVTILEMILPDSKNKKFIKMVMSIYILFTIISPIVKFVSKKEINFDKFVEIEDKKITASSIETNASITNVYETSIKCDIKNKIEQKGFKVNNVSIKTERNDNENMGKIYSIKVELEKEENKTKSHVDAVKIEIGYSKNNNHKLDNREIEEIKELLSSTYGVESEQINIT